MKRLFIVLFTFFILSGCSASELDNTLDAIETAGEIVNKISTETEKFQSGEKVKAKVTDTTDGDTIEVTLINSEGVFSSDTQKVRILSIDTPEKFGPKAKEGPQPFAEEASKRAEELLLGKEVTLELSKNENPYDKYDRLLANVWLDANTLYQEVMLKEGLARLACIFEPDTQYIKTVLEPAQSSAEDSQTGIWSIKGYVHEDGYKH